MDKLKKITSWCATILTLYEFPDKPQKKDNTNQIYCINYPYLPVDDSFPISTDFIESKYNRHQEIRKLFSLQNVILYLAAFHVIAFLLFYLLGIVFLLSFYSSHNWSLLGYSIGSFISGFIYQIASKGYIYSLNRDYLEVFCILQAYYISLDLSLSNSLSSRELRKSLKRRIEKLSKLIYILGKSEQDGSGYYFRVSQDIYSKIDSITIADGDNSKTLRELRNYFNQTTNCLIRWDTKNLPIDKSLLVQPQKKKWKNFIVNIEQNLTKTDNITKSLMNITKNTSEIFKNTSEIFKYIVPSIISIITFLVMYVFNK